MGGTAFGFACRRLGRLEHDDMTLEACDILRQLGITPHPIPCHRSKDDHGDIDILAVGAEGRRPEIEESFRAGKSIKNGECLSLLWKGTQLDIVYVDRELVDAAVGYFSWPDLGNFLGRIARAAGFRYGHRGLSRWVGRRGGEKSTAITVSDQTKDIFSFLGVDYSRWEGGFDEPGDIYNFVASSPFFSRRIFEPRALDHRARVRNRKRQVYAGLLDWAADKSLHDFDFGGCSDEWWDQRVMEQFGQDWFLKRDRWLAGEQSQIAIKLKFSGNKVREITGLDGPELGHFIRQFKASMGGSFHNWVLAASQADIEDALVGFFSQRERS